MKFRILKASLLLAAFMAVSPALTAENYEGRVSVRQDVFAQEGDSVRVEMSISMNGTRVRNNSYVTIVPVLHSGSITLLLPSVQINGRSRQKAWDRLVILHKQDNTKATIIAAGTRDTRRSNYTYRYSAVVPYESWMDNSEFFVREDQCNCAGPVMPVAYDLMARNLRKPAPAVPPVPPKPYEPQLIVSFVTPDVEAVKNRSEAGKAYLDFQTGRSEILPDFKNNAAELDKIHKLIQSVKDDKYSTITGITVDGYASPDGSYTSNQTLSEKRAGSLKNNLEVVYSFPSNLFTVRGRGEDWITLDTLVAHSGMQYQAQALAIIRGSDNYDARERRLMALASGVPYRQIKTDFYPKLRRSDYELKYTVRSFSVEEAKEVIQTRPSSLSLNEMFMISQTYDKGSDAFNETFETAARLFPVNDVANLNAAASALSRKDIQGAMRYMSKIKAQTSGAYYNNMGVICFMRGDREKAADYFAKAKYAACPEAQHNLDELAKK